MKSIFAGARQTLEVPCTVEIEHTAESLHAHVDLATDIEIQPGDEVVVLGEHVSVPFGERVLLHRRATISRAGSAERAWTRLLAYLELTELYEVGFSAGRNA